MKKILFAVLAIKALANSTNGNKRFSLIGGRGGLRCVIVLNDGETLDSLGVKEGTQVVAMERTIETTGGEVVNAFYYTGNFDVKQELSNDYDYQIQLAKTKGLAQAQAMANPALAALFTGQAAPVVA